MALRTALERLLATRRDFLHRGAAGALTALLLLRSTTVAAGGDRNRKKDGKKKRRRSDKGTKRKRKGRDERASPYAERLEPIAAPELRPAALGRYQGDVRIRVARVLDLVESRPAELLGGIGDVGLVSKPRRDTVQAALSALVEAGGLFTEGAAPLEMDVYLLRYGVLRLPARLRAEVMLLFIFRREGERVDRRVLACGNAEAVASGAGRPINEMPEPVYHAAFEDAFEKLVSSDTFRELTGSGWSPGTGFPSRAGTARAADEGYRASAWAAETLPALAGAVQAPSRLDLENLAVMDTDYMREGRDPGRAGTRLPALLGEHLATFYPGAFRMRRTEGASRSGARGRLLVTGAVRGYNPAGRRHELLVDLYLKDGETDLNLFALQTRRTHRAETPGGGTSACGATQWRYDGDPDINQMEERMASDLAYLLVMSRPQPYFYPHDLEVRFDGRQRPPGLTRA